MKKSKYLLTNLLLLLIATPIFAQEDYKPQITREINLTFPDSSIIFNVYIKHTSIKIKDNLTYCWFKADKLFSNQGGYSGSLLNGKYSMYDKFKRLRSEGLYAEGLKIGTWKTWNENGLITSIVIWEKGQKDGEANYFDNYGNLKKVIPYKNNRLHGTMIVYQGKNIEKTNYKNGILVKEKVKVKKDTSKKSITTQSTTNTESTDKSKTKKKSFFNFLKKKEKKDDSTIAQDKDKNQVSSDTAKPKKRSFFNIFKKKKKNKETKTENKTETVSPKS